MSLAIPVTIPIKALQLAPGSTLIISDVTWNQYEAILTELGENRQVPRLVYCDGTLEIMSPLAIHERPHRIIGYIVTTLLDAEERDWEDFGSTTCQRQQKQAGLEPDTCFYIQNAERMRHCERLDLEVDPPPDLAIESDVTSKTTLEAYQRIGVPEVWVYHTSKLKIHLLQNGNYIESDVSPTFPNAAIAELIPQLVERAFVVGTSRMLRELREQIVAL